MYRYIKVMYMLSFFLEDPLNLSQIGQGLNSRLRLSTQMFYGVQVWALAGPVKCVLKPLQHCRSCMFWVVVVLKGEPSLQSEVVCKQEQVFFNNLSVFCRIYPFWQVSLSLLLESAPKAQCCHHHASLYGWFQPVDEQNVVFFYLFFSFFCEISLNTVF